MSSDDGIYILITKGDTEVNPLEYRVAWAMNIENLNGADDGFSSWYANDIFGTSTVHSDLNKALEEAVTQLQDIIKNDSVIEDGELVYLGCPEYGIQVEDFSGYSFPTG